MTDFLAIDTSSRYLTVIAQKEGRRALRYIPDCAMNHSVVLMGEIQSALDEVGLTPEGCGFFAAVTGPGSFTGIRIGIATAKGFAAGAGKPLVSITSFDMLAYNVKDEKFYCVIDAAHGYYYTCGYCGGQVCDPPAYRSGEAVSALGCPLYGFENLDFGGYTQLNPADCLYNAVIANSDKACGEMSALYVRKSQAEENRKC